MQIENQSKLARHGPFNRWKLTRTFSIGWKSGRFLIFDEQSIIDQIAGSEWASTTTTGTGDFLLHLRIKYHIEFELKLFSPFIFLVDYCLDKFTNNISSKDVIENGLQERIGK